MAARPGAPSRGSSAGSRRRARAPAARRGVASAAFTASRSASSVGGPLRVGHDEGDDPLAPLVVVARRDRDLRNAGKLGEHLLDRVGPHVLAAGDDQVVAATVHDEPAVVVERADVTGREPALRGASGRCRRGSSAAASALAAGCCRRRRRSHLDAVERHPVVDDAAAGLGHAVGRRRRWRGASRAEPRRRARSPGRAPGRCGAARSGTSETSVAPRRAAAPRPPRRTPGGRRAACR